MKPNRHKYTIIFAMSDQWSVTALASSFGKLLTRVYGGCTITNAEGYWAEDASEDKVSYGSQMIEPARKVEVVTSKKQRSEIIVLFKQAINDTPEYDFKDQWIHFEHTEIECEHFQI